MFDQAFINEVKDRIQDVSSDEIFEAWKGEKVTHNDLPYISIEATNKALEEAGLANCSEDWLMVAQDQGAIYQTTIDGHDYWTPMV